MHTFPSIFRSGTFRTPSMGGQVKVAGPTAHMVMSAGEGPCLEWTAILSRNRYLGVHDLLEIDDAPHRRVYQ